jgi:hypothetical protein
VSAERAEARSEPVASTHRPPRIRLEMQLVDEAGNVLASTVEPFELGRFDLAAARQGMRKMLAGLGGITDQPPSAS